MCAPRDALCVGEIMGTRAAIGMLAGPPAMFGVQWQWGYSLCIPPDPSHVWLWGSVSHVTIW